jgi:ribulose-5-phosphate 4-epimerase/fuculose-1-phosphate aldolase
MENHGPVALGRNEADALQIMLMADKWARVLAGAYTFGGPAYFDDKVSKDLENRPDEKYRRKIIGS